MVECISGDAERRANGAKCTWTTNSDVATTAEWHLGASPYIALRSIVCEFHAGVLLLRGQVTSYHLKQRAQEAVRMLKGVEIVVNLVEVEQRTNGTS